MKRQLVGDMDFHGKRENERLFVETSSLLALPPGSRREAAYRYDSLFSIFAYQYWRKGP
jgi:hypothetical protein